MTYGEAVVTLCGLGLWGARGDVDVGGVPLTAVREAGRES